ncbi:MAG: translation initiation factor IF-3 [Burkholderiales bacterium]
MAQEKEARINGEITAPEVRVIGADGSQVGVISIAAANKLAEEAELDLVEIAPTASPPVCRVMDYGKFKYRESKKQHEARLKQKQIVVKEVKFRPGTDEGDYKIKLRNLTRFLEEGDKTKITLRFRGREMAHQEFGIRLLERVKADLEALGVVEQFPKMEGRQLVMVLAPKKVAPKAAVKSSPKAAPKSEGTKPAETPGKVAAADGATAQNAAAGDKK